MSRSVLVYDDFHDCFRSLDTTNYNDDIVVGTVFFHRDALSAIKKSFRICGYVIIDDNGISYPVDIHKNEVVILEGTYNSLPYEVQDDLVEYNLHEKPNMIWSPFFLGWLFLCDRDVFSKHGYFYRVCELVLSNKQIFEKLLRKKIDIVYPANYHELCQLARNLTTLLETELYNKEYFEEVNYAFDSLINGYRLNLSPAEVETYCQYICSCLYNSLEESND